MRLDNQKVYIVFGVLILIIIIGFYFMVNKLNSLNQTIQNLQNQNQPSQNQKNQTILPDLSSSTNNNNQSPAPTSSSPTNTSSLIDIPTSIIFTASSSPLLTPQTALTITIQDVSEASDGTITVNIKVFANNATSYSALDAQNDFQLVDTTGGGNNQNPLAVSSQLNAIAPQNAVTGSVTFKTNPGNANIILQVGSGDQIKFYQFNFANQTYKETILG